MSIQGFRGNCDSQGKLGMCPSLAEPYKISQEFPIHEIDIFPVFSPIALTFLPNCDTI